jgi:hypothetical protein
MLLQKSSSLKASVVSPPREGSPSSVPARLPAAAATIASSRSTTERAERSTSIPIVSGFLAQSVGSGSERATVAIENVLCTPFRTTTQYNTCHRLSSAINACTPDARTPLVGCRGHDVGVPVRVCEHRKHLPQMVQRQRLALALKCRVSALSTHWQSLGLSAGKSLPPPP